MVRDVKPWRDGRREGVLGARADGQLDSAQQTDVSLAAKRNAEVAKGSCRGHPRRRQHSQRRSDSYSSWIESSLRRGRGLSGSRRRVERRSGTAGHPHTRSASGAAVGQDLLPVSSRSLQRRALCCARARVRRRVAMERCGCRRQRVAGGDGVVWCGVGMGMGMG